MKSPAPSALPAESQKCSTASASLLSPSASSHWAKSSTSSTNKASQFPSFATAKSHVRDCPGQNSKKHSPHGCAAPASVFPLALSPSVVRKCPPLWHTQPNATWISAVRIPSSATKVLSVVSLAQKLQVTLPPVP